MEICGHERCALECVWLAGWGWLGGGGVDQGLAELGKERVVLWPRVAKVSCAEKPSAPHQPEHPPRSLQMGNI